uniref:Methyltransf_21 domain-containing protein n=1 Tax=Steinernema glaseri TaxID=37863 RepID=A0A1I7Z2S2_9BILA
MRRLVSTRYLVLIAGCAFIILIFYRDLLYTKINEYQNVESMAVPFDKGEEIIDLNRKPTVIDISEDKAKVVDTPDDKTKAIDTPEDKAKTVLEPNRKTLMNGYSDCIAQKVNPLPADQVWHGLVQFVADCEKTSGLNISAFAALQNEDEIKYHLPAKVSIESCLVLSLGVGLDTRSEEALHNVQPQCHFIGSDPTVQGNKELYEKIGKFHPYAIGNSNGVVESVVINGFDNKYRRENLTTMEFVKFMKEHVNETLVDNLFLDAEYAEYGLFSYFLKGGNLDTSGIVICQVNIEIHKPNAQQTEEFASFLKKLLEEKRYSVFKVFKVDIWDHHRVILINYDQDQCVERYFSMKDGVLHL